MNTQEQIQFCKHYIYLWDVLTQNTSNEESPEVKSLNRLWELFSMEQELPNKATEALSMLLEREESIDLIGVLPDHPRTIVGDGKLPNRWFVTISPNYYVQNPDDNTCWDIEEFPSATEADTVTYGPFSSLEEAQTLYENTDLDAGLLIGSVMIEDRLQGIVKDKNLYKVVKTTIEYLDYNP